ncbi:MAG: hypothetical protein ACRD9Y_19635 [Blastocatellia bacterium]
MQSESRFAPSFSESIGIQKVTVPSQLRNRNRIVHQIKVEVAAKPRESQLDIISTAVVIGMTAQFVIFLFGLVTEFMPRLFGSTLISASVGLCVGVIAYALMKSSD